MCDKSFQCRTAFPKQNKYGTLDSKIRGRSKKGEGEENIRDRPPSHAARHRVNKHMIQNENKQKHFSLQLYDLTISSS